MLSVDRTKRKRDRLREMYGDLCYICGLPMKFKQPKGGGGEDIGASLDHLIQGDNDITNLRLAHRWCNSARHHEPLTEELVSRCKQEIKYRLENNISVIYRF